MFRLISTLIISFIVSVFSLSALAVEKTKISDIQIGYDGKGLTRVVLHADRELDYKQSSFVQGGLRQVLDFDRVIWALPNGADSKGEGRGVGGIQRYRYAHYTDTVSRLVFDLDHPIIIESTFSIPPSREHRYWRMVLDFRSTDLKTLESLRGVSKVLPGTRSDKVDNVGIERVSLPQKHVIVIDPGHGGRDPGAIGKKGAYEKTINLNAALILEKQLLASKRYEVIMTRDDDVYVDYEERIRIAREAGADLFISIHADAAGNPRVEGASVYTLSKKGDERVETLRKEENWGVPLEVDREFEDVEPEVEDILRSLMVKETQNYSAEFANILIPELAKAGPVLRNTHRKANFYVLLTQNVPAVLLEVGFLTNSKDEARLTSKKGLQKSVNAIYSAIEIYFEQHDRLNERFES